ncbi:MAG: hypothetical protein HY361_05050 [Candidatus Aenigmarchaeota archaeon]|nr:hypothetical protein [Candidatus Aenigmarchaeota archaeon]
MFNQEDYLKRSLKRIVDEISDMQERRENLSRVGGLIEKYNETVLLAKELNKENPTVTKYGETINDGFFGQHNIIVGLEIIKNRTTSIIDSLGIDFSELNKITSTIPAIQLHQNISQFQNLEQRISINNIIEAIEPLGLSESNKQILVNKVREFDTELNKSEKDENKLLQILKEIKNKGQKLLPQLIAYAMQKGFDKILDKLFS